MFEKLLADLRFVIGLFFAIISLILIGAGAFGVSEGPFPDLNLSVGLGISVFAFFMLFLAIYSYKKGP